MKIIIGVKRKIAIDMDEEDVFLLKKYSWCVTKNIRNKCYRVTTSLKKVKPRKTIYLHRLIMNCPSDMQVDHINGDTLDNRKCNLRLCVQHENSRNRIRNRHKGACFRKKYNRWQAYINLNNPKRFKSLGFFLNKKEALLAYNEAAKSYFGDFACLNKVS